MELISRYLRFASNFWLKQKTLSQKNQFCKIKQLKKTPINKKTILQHLDHQLQASSIQFRIPHGFHMILKPPQTLESSRETHPSTGWGWILPRHDAFDLDQLFHLGSLPNSESSAPGRRLQALLRQAEAPGRRELTGVT